MTNDSCQQRMPHNFLGWRLDSKLASFECVLAGAALCVGLSVAQDVLHDDPIHIWGEIVLPAISGAIIGDLSQTPTLLNPGHARYEWILIYNASSCVCLGTSCHLLLCTAFLAVFGQV